MQIDMKNATVRIRDGTVLGGSTAKGAINNASGYAVAAVTLVVDGSDFTAALPAGARFTIVNTDGSKSEYNIASSSSATNLVIAAPGLVKAVSDNAVITIYPNEIEVKVGEGNLTWTEKVNRQYTRDRGALDTVRNGDEEPVDVKLDATWEWIKAATGATPTIEDALKKRGEASDWVTSSSDPCEPYAVDIEVHYIPDCGDEETEIILLEDFRYEQLDHDLKAGTISTSGKCNRTEASVSRVDWSA